MRCYHKILHISYKDHATDEEVRAKIQQAIGPHEDLLTIVERRKLQWYCHVSRSSGLAKTILQGTVKGRRRRGRQRKRWEDNIREWTGLEFAKSQRAVENREKWRELVAKSSVVPQRPSRLRDWWDEVRESGLNCSLKFDIIKAPTVSSTQLCVSESRWCTMECEQRSILLQSQVECGLHPSWNGQV